MKNILVIVFISCCSFSAIAQDLIKEIQKLTLVNDSLQKQVIKPLKDSISHLNTYYHNDITMLYKQIDTLQKEKIYLQQKISKIEKENTELNTNKIKNERDSLQILLGKLNTNLSELKQISLQKEKEIFDTKQKCLENALAEKEKGRQEVFSSIAIKYSGKTFDELIMSTTKQSVMTDILLVESNPQIKSTIQDLLKYFNAEQLFLEKFNANQITYYKNQLNQINQESKLLTYKKDLLENYESFNDGLKTTIEKIIALDEREIVYGMGDVIERQKFIKIFAELTSYIFDYDFNFTDYPYLSDIVLEIIKRKQPNCDADISDLLNKL